MKGLATGRDQTYEKFGVDYNLLALLGRAGEGIKQELFNDYH